MSKPFSLRKESNFSDEVVADARAFIREKMNLPHDATLATHLRLFSSAAIKVRKATRAQHLEAVAFVYAVYAEGQLDPDFDAEVRELADSIDKKVTKRTDALHVLLEAFISYGGDTRKERSDARRLFSRDAQAIRHLIRANIPPSVAAQEGVKKGEGLDAWAVRMRPKVGTTSEPADQSAAPQTVEEVESDRAQSEVSRNPSNFDRDKVAAALEDATRRVTTLKISITPVYPHRVGPEHHFHVKDISQREINDIIESIRQLPQVEENMPATD